MHLFCNRIQIQQPMSLTNWLIKYSTKTAPLMQDFLIGCSADSTLSSMPLMQFVCQLRRRNHFTSSTQEASLASYLGQIDLTFRRPHGLAPPHRATDLQVVSGMESRHWLRSQLDVLPQIARLSLLLHCEPRPQCGHFECKFSENHWRPSSFSLSFRD